MFGKVYHVTLGSHVHMRIFANGGKLGDLCCRVEEFDALVRAMNGFAFINEGEDMIVSRSEH